MRARIPVRIDHLPPDLNVVVNPGQPGGTALAENQRPQLPVIENHIVLKPLGNLSQEKGSINVESHFISRIQIPDFIQYLVSRHICGKFKIIRNFKPDVLDDIFGDTGLL